MHKAIAGFSRCLFLAAALFSGAGAGAQEDGGPGPEAAQFTSDAAPVMVREERVRNLIILIAAAILIITMATLIVLLVKRGRDYRKPPEDVTADAFLVAAGRGSEPYRLGRKATMLGRIAGKHSGHLDYLVVPESTVGRRHAVIEYKDYAWWIVDQGSINGTFVNDVRINSEVRLKHGDRIRLHRYEYDFVIPELEEAPMTQVSNTVFAGEDRALELDLEAVRGSMAGGAPVALDLDFSSGADAGEDGRGDETLLPGHEMDAGTAAQRGDETLLPDFNRAPAPGAVAEDETLLPGRFEEDDEDATIRPESNNRSAGIFNVTGTDDEDR